MKTGTWPNLRELVTATPREQLVELVGDLAAAHAEAFLRLAAPTSPSASADVCNEGNISVDEAARRLGMSGQWIYRHADRLPFVRKIGRRVLCSAQGVAEWSDRQRR